MILVDSSVWIDHFSTADTVLELVLKQGKVLSHPFVTGELAVGNLRPRAGVLRLLHEPTPAIVAHDEDVLEFIAIHKLFGLGIGYIDAHLLASTQLTPEAKLWTRDKRLLSAAEHLGLAWDGSRLN